MMKKMSRRVLLRTIVAAPVARVFGSKVSGKVSIPAIKPTDIRVEEVRFGYEDHVYRAPYKFGGRTVDRVTILNVNCVVSTARGRTAEGFGSMTMGNMWSFPSRVMNYDATLGAMKALAGKIAEITSAYKQLRHPVDINWALEPAYLKAAEEVSHYLGLAEPIPKLCTLVTASAFDAALHDAFGKAHGVSCYHAYGRDFMSHDLSRYLGTDFKGHYLDQYVLKEPQPRTWLYHSVGGADPITEADITVRIGDGLPETLGEWIAHNGITHLKLKLNGGDLRWDVERVVRIDRAAAETMRRRGVKRWYYCLDFNENCPNVAYLMDFLMQIKTKCPPDSGAFNTSNNPPRATSRKIGRT